MSSWDEHFACHSTAGTDPDWGGRWTEPFLPLLQKAGAERVLELRSYCDIARSTASASSGERAIGARPRSSSLT